MNVDRRDVVLRVVLLIGICVSGTANVLPNSTGNSLYCSKLSGEGLEACKYGLYVGTHPQLYPDLANKNFPSYCKGMCEKKSESMVYGRHCTAACVYAGREVERNTSVAEQMTIYNIGLTTIEKIPRSNMRVLEQFTTSPGNVSNTTKHNKNHTHPGANIVDKDARSNEVLNTKNDEETFRTVLTPSTKRSRELSKQEQSIENSTAAASTELKRLQAEKEADGLKKKELKQNSLKDGVRLSKSAVNEELKNLMEHESKLDSAIQIARAKLAKLRQESEKPRKNCKLNWSKRRSKRRRRKLC